MSGRTQAEEIAEILLNSGAVELRPNKPFTWASGWKSPIYCDNRKTLSDPKGRSRISQILSEEIKKSFLEANLVAGVATAGIPQASIVADYLELPLVYVRSKPKGHGQENLIEGKILPGSKAVVIEDLVSTGGSSIKACHALREAGVEVQGLLATFTYGFPLAKEAFSEVKIPLITLGSYTELLPKALEFGLIQESDLQVLESWRENPSLWMQS